MADREKRYGFLVEDLRGEYSKVFYDTLSEMCRDMRFTESTMRAHFGAVLRDGSDCRSVVKLEKGRYLVQLCRKK